MKFGPCPTDQAIGAILAHSHALSDGRLRKGQVLDQSDVARLLAEGVTEVTVARLEPGDVAEDAAAQQLAQAIVPDSNRAHLTLGSAATGRVNLHAAAIGVVEIDADAITAANRVHPMITVATVPPWQRVAPRVMVATVKIISYAVPPSALDTACALAQGAMRVRPTAYRSAALIQTTVGQEDGEKGHNALYHRLDRLNVTLAPKHLVPHDEPALADALRGSSADVLFILTGSATSDLADTAPQAVRRAGGQVDYFGMPVDPGNLLFQGSLNGKPVIGLPGCARSPALNGADWVMERVLCGVPVTQDDISAMGVGGLLKEIPTRPRPRDVS